MKYILCCFLAGILTTGRAQVAPPESYLASTITQLQIEWPKNKTINLVFHGHSVPGGYWNDHRVETLQSYPYLVLSALKAKYPFALINVIVTAKGGENSIDGQLRFTSVLAHQPDVLFIDYALNDRGAGLEKSKVAWTKMIEAAQAAGTKVVLLTPTPDQRVDMTDSNNQLEQHSRQVAELAKNYQTGLVDSYALFKNVLTKEGSIKPYMSWVNHPNKKGHLMVADAIVRYFGL